MNIYSKDTYELEVTEQLSKKNFFIYIPYFLNFNFKKFKKTLVECKKLNLID